METPSIQLLKWAQLQPGAYQPRTAFEESALKSLADSIRLQGILQPLIVRCLSETEARYEIVAGERRWRAAQQVGLDTVPVIIRDLSAQEALEIALIENLQREELTPLEEARALQRLIETFHLTHEAAAEAVGRSRSAVSNALRLLQLSPPVLALVEAGTLEAGHARALLTLPPHTQLAWAHKIISEGLSVRQVETQRRQPLDTPRPSLPKTMISADIRALEERLSAQLNLPVVIRHGKKGAGKIEIHYANLEECDAFLHYIER